jgi:hypothetical protein
MPDGSAEGPLEGGHVHASPNGHRHGTDAIHSHAHTGPHRHLPELLAIINRGPLSPWVKERATAAFRLLAEAEAAVHGVAPDQVHLHEVGALDALVDIVGSVEGFERLGVTDIYSRPVAMGEGWVRAAHGTLPVPAPATSVLLEGLRIGPNGPVHGEATTPTGAALLRALTHGPAPSHWRVRRSGWGAGTRDPSHYPNALRLILAEGAAEAGEVAVVSTDLDDMSPEYLEPLREALVAAGAIDVQSWVTQMKKGRTGFRVEAVVPAGAEEAVARAFFDHSPTAGIRRVTAERRTLARHVVEWPAADGGTFHAKILEGLGAVRAKPEYEDVTRVARATGRPAIEVAAEAKTMAERLAVETAGQEIAHKEQT